MTSKWRLLAASAGCFLTLGLSNYMPAQAQATFDESPQFISRINVEGNVRIEASTIRSYLLVAAGDTFDSERIDLSLKTLFRTGLFADVVIEKDGSELLVKVLENPIVNRVIIEGNRAMSTDKLTDEIQAAPREIFTPARVQADVQRILEVYRRSGRFAVQVTPAYEQLEQNRVDLIFEIDEGAKTGIRAINFLGNQAFSDRELRGALVTKESKFWRFFSSQDNYDPDKMEYDREQLRKFYTNAGYADFNVTSAVAELTQDREDFYITFTIEEGPKFNFGEIKVETALDKLNGEVLAAILPMRKGNVYRGEMIENAIDTLTFAAGSAGYAFVDIRPRVETNKETKTVDITFVVDEGPRVYVDRINIVGNTRTLDKVIRRELRVSEGDAFNRVLLDRSRNRVRALGFFKEVELEELPSDKPDRTVVEIAVEEQQTGEMSFAAGYSSVDDVLFELSVTERNLRGRGQSLRARVSTSRRRDMIDFGFTEPRFRGRSVAAGIDVFHRKDDYLDVASFSNTRTGTGLRLGFQTGETTSLQLRYNLIQENIDYGLLDPQTGQPGVELNPTFDTTQPISAANPFINIIDNCSSNHVPFAAIAPDGTAFNSAGPGLHCSNEGTRITSAVGASFNWDRRNDPISPTRGFVTSISSDLAGVGGDVHYLKTELRGSVYRGLFERFFDDVVASVSLNAGYNYSWGKDDIRINDRFFKGGSSFRGFGVAGIGPRYLTYIRTSDFDPTTDDPVQLQVGSALGGNAYAIGALEVKFPLGLPEDTGIKGSVFAEFGTLGSLDARELPPPSTITGPTGGLAFNQGAVTLVDDDFSLRASVGFSVFWDSPFGPVRFDFSKLVAREIYDQSETFRFSSAARF